MLPSKETKEANLTQIREKNLSDLNVIIGWTSQKHKPPQGTNLDAQEKAWRDFLLAAQKAKHECRSGQELGSMDSTDTMSSKTCTNAIKSAFNAESLYEKIGGN